MFTKTLYAFSGETRLGLMWTCMTLYNRPQVCFTPELQPEWLIALICIFVGCICITTTIILLASSNWDRNVIPYARWVGFTASKLFWGSLHWTPQQLTSRNLSSGSLLLCGCNLPAGIPCRRNRWSTVPFATFAPGWHFVHYVCARSLDYGHLGIVCRKGLSAAVLSRQIGGIGNETPTSKIPNNLHSIFQWE